MITAIVLTRNDSATIDRCLASLTWCDEIVVVDDYSTDNTVKRIRNPLGHTQGKHESGIRIKIFSRKLESDFAEQRNWALSKASGDWVLFVDADEEVSEELRQEIQEALRDKDVYGYFFSRRDFFMGRWLTYGETANVRLLRLARRDAGKWEGAVHETWNISGPKDTLRHPLLHYPHPDLSSFLADINRYSDLVAGQMEKDTAGLPFWKIFVYPVGKFLYSYFLLGGFLDGTPGFLMAMFMSFHSFLAKAKYWQRVHRKKS